MATATSRNTIIANRVQELLNSRQGQVITVSAVSTIAVILLLVLGIFPAINSILIQVEQNQELEVALLEIDQTTQVLSALTQELQQKPEIEAALKNVMPRELNQELILARITDISGQVGVELDNIRFFNTPSNREVDLFNELSGLPVNSKQISVTASGSLSQLQSLVRELEESTYIFNIQNLNLTLVTESSQLRYQIIVQAEVYFLDEII